MIELRWSYSCPISALALAAFAILVATPVTAVAEDSEQAPTVVAQASQPAADTDADGDQEDDADTDTEADAEADGDDVSTLQRGGRMEFDTRLVRGERAGSGAVFLFQRPPRALPSMIERRTSYLDGTVHQVFGDDGVERLNESRGSD